MSPHEYRSYRVILGFGFRVILGLGFRVILGLGFRVILGLGFRGVLLGLYRENGKENGSCSSILGLFWGFIGVR